MSIARPHSGAAALAAKDRNNAALNRSAAFASISMAAVLVVIKGWAAWSTGSTAMLGSLADTALDLVASLATLAGVWVAGQPADDNHRFGHGKAEALSAMLQVVLIAISAISLAVHAGQELFAAAPVSAPGDGIIVSAIAIVMTLALVAWQRRVVARTGSIAIAADQVHYQADLVVNFAVIAALLLTRYAHWTRADPVLGLAIAVWLGWGAWNASQAAIVQLMDHEWPEEKKARFLNVLARHPDLHGVHDLRTRTAGNRDFVQFHLWVDGAMTVAEAHQVMDGIEARLAVEFPGLEILIHPDPDGHVDHNGAVFEELGVGAPIE